MRRLCPLLILLVAGCTERPQAPALRDDPVYDNPAAGLRFAAPPNWSMVARSDQPREGPGERLLVRYQVATHVVRATFEVTLDAKPDSENVEALVKQGSHGVMNWEMVGTPAPITVGQVPGTRYILKHKGTTKEVVAIRRDNRLFLFTLIAATLDTESREQIRRVIDGVTWTK
jgi:hypothetical protein